MKTAACLAAILGSAAAFAPAQTGKASTALRAFEDEVRKDDCSHRKILFLGTSMHWHRQVLLLFNFNLSQIGTS
jgi:hypothetical protein